MANDAPAPGIESGRGCTSTSSLLLPRRCRSKGLDQFVLQPLQLDRKVAILPMKSLVMRRWLCRENEDLGAGYSK